jgi:hypothetical protein
MAPDVVPRAGISPARQENTEGERESCELPPYVSGTVRREGIAACGTALEYKQLRALRQWLLLPAEPNAETPMRDPDDLFQALAQSAFRRRQKLGAADLAYLRGRGMDTVLRHADEMIAGRLAPAEPLNDGKQTPMRGHPVFVAQHATGTCCRGCLA